MNQVETANTISGFSTKTTVGMMLDGFTIDNMVLGGPAYNSQQLVKGDVITKVHAPHFSGSTFSCCDSQPSTD